MNDTKEANHCLKLIFKQLNLNEQANVRLASKRFKKLCDSIEIRKLVVYENAKRSVGKLAYTGQAYGLVDGVTVFDLQKLFNNRKLMRKMRSSLETLVIYACYLNAETNEYKLKSRFSELRHLELYNISITSSDIVEHSKKIECLVLHNVVLKSKKFFDVKMRNYEARIKDHWAKKDQFLFIEDRGNTSPMFQFLGLEAFQSPNLKYFSTNFAFDMPAFFIDCINAEVFKSLVQIDLVAYDLCNLGLLIEKSPYLRVIKLRFYMLSKLFKQVGTKRDMMNIMSQFRDDVSVYLYNQLWNKQTAKSLFEFLGDLMEIELPGNREVLGVDGEGDLDFVITYPVYKYLSELDEQQGELAKRFFEEIGCIQTSTQLIERDRAFFWLFRNCEKVNLKVNSPSIDCAFSAFRSLVKVRLEFPIVEYGEMILCPIGERCSLVQHLTVVIFSKVNNFDFLFELKCLKSISLLLYQPIGQAVVIQLLMELVHLQNLSVYFVKPSCLTRKELTSFKKSINDTFSKKFKARDLRFQVKILTRKNTKEEVIRYLLDKVNSIEDDALLGSEMNTMFRFAAQSEKLA